MVCSSLLKAHRMGLSQFACHSLLPFIGLVSCLTAVSVSADVRITEHGTMSLQSKQSSGKRAWTRIIEIKGQRMRLESGEGAEPRGTIYDLDSGKRFRLAPSSREVLVLDLGKVSIRWRKQVRVEQLSRQVRPSGAQREVLNLPCTEFTFDFLAPASLPNHQIAHDRGTVCVTDTAPAGVEFASFVHEARKRGFDLVVATLSPTFSPIGSYFWGDESNFIVLSGMTASGYDANPGAHVESFAYESAWMVTEISSDPIPNERFDIPNGWKQKRDDGFDRVSFSRPTSRSRTLVRRVKSR